eukprot:TRINITY_DN1686_c0_g1_i1.p3 TRINITY_DN1686_c0_g1~~TRINITY_DN1686_c0_g1_i1.p3  ORF type:complete len:371 (-),score=27.54 TRINITY_DN1686_c0_g1_i1:2356-3468(-)
MEQNCFNIIDDLHYLLNLCSAKALPKGIHLTFAREAGFPKEMVGDKEKFDFVIFTILDHFIEHSNNTDIVLAGKTNSPTGSGLLLGFHIKGPKNEHINSELLSITLGKTHISLNEYIREKGPLEKYEMGLFQCNEILKLMSGTIRVGEPTSEEVEVGIELPFDTRESMQNAMEIPKLSIYQTEKVNEYTLRWTPIVLTERPKSERPKERKPPERVLEPMSIRFMPREEYPGKYAQASKDLREQKADLLAKIKLEAEQSRTPVSQNIPIQDHLDITPIPIKDKEGSRSAPSEAKTSGISKEEQKFRPQQEEELEKVDETEYRVFSLTRQQTGRIQQPDYTYINLVKGLALNNGPYHPCSLQEKAVRQWQSP